MKKKKLGINHVLNKELKPLLDAGGNRYPVYTRITFNRKNTKFPNHFTFAVHGLTDEEFISIFEKKEGNTAFQDEIESFNKDIEKIVRFEYDMLKDKFSIRNINDRFIHYQDALFPFAVSLANDKLSDFVSDLSNTVLEDEKKLSICSLLSESFFEDGYTLASSLIPDIKDRIHNNLKIELTALVQLFYAPLDKEDGHVEAKIIDWLDFDTKRDYKDFILNPFSEEQILRGESIDSPQRYLYREFLPDCSMVGYYITVINKMIANSFS